MIEPNKSERAICSGKITKIKKNNEFIHSMDSRAFSSGSPICLIDNKLVVGIHKQGDKILPINYGTFLGSIIDFIEKKSTHEEIEELKNEEHYFKFSNLKIIDSIQNSQGIKNIIIYENKDNKKKIIIVKSISEISIYDLTTKKFMFKILLNSNVEKNYYPLSKSKDKLEIINKIYYHKFQYNFEKSDILVITNEYMILINPDKNKGKILENIEEKYEKFFKGEFTKEQSIYRMEYLSNLDVFIGAYKKNKENDFKYKYVYFFRNNKLYKKYDNNSWLPLIEGTYEINGKFFITYFYSRGNSTTTIYDMNDKYKIVYEKRYGHYCNYFNIKDKYLILPYNIEYYPHYPHPKFTELNLLTFEFSEINFEIACIIKHRFSEKRYLMADSEGENWYIVEENGSNNFVVKEQINNNNIFYGKELLFLENNLILT